MMAKLSWLQWKEHTGNGRHGRNNGNHMDAPVAHLIGIFRPICVETHGETDCKADGSLGGVKGVREWPMYRQTQLACGFRQRGYAEFDKTPDP